MAKVQGTFYTGEKLRRGTSPVSPPYLGEDGQPYPVNPPGSPAISYLSLVDTKDASYIGKSGFVPVVTGEDGLLLQPIPQLQENGLISGGVVQWTGAGYVFNVSEALARFQAVSLISSVAQVTLDAADPTDDRKDAFVLDVTFVDGVPVSMAPNKITGTPSATPIVPQIDPSYQIFLTSVDVPAASTAPTLTEEVIYDENIEWTGSSTGTGTVIFNSAADPYQGSLSIEATNIQNGLKIRLTRGSDFDLSTVQTFGEQLKLKATMGAGINIGITFLDSSANPICNELILNQDKASLDYQFIGLALSQFSFTSYLARSVEFRYIRTKGTIIYSGFFMDILKFEGGINPPVTTGSFLGLSDTPSSYSGQASKVVSVKADESGLEFTTPSGGISGLTANEIVYATSPTTIGTLAVMTYPSLAELAYVKGVTSAIQTQLNGKQSTIAGTLTNGHVATVVDGVPTWAAPSSGSNWTVGSGFIYRNGPVVIGDTSWSNDASLTVKGNATASSWVLKVLDSAGSNLIQLLDDRRLSLFSDIINIGNSPSGASGVTIKSYYTGAESLLQLIDSVGSILFNIGSNGETYFRDDRINFGLPVAAPTTGLTVKVPGTGFTFGLQIQDSTNAKNLNLYANGSVYSTATRHSFGPISGSIADGAHFKGASTGTNAQFAIDNSAATRLLSVLGNGDISFSEGRGFIFGTTTGWKLGTATSQKLSFWNKTPIIQPTTAITGATLVSNLGTPITSTDTFGGYTIAQLAAILINTGLTA